MEHKSSIDKQDASYMDPCRIHSNQHQDTASYVWTLEYNRVQIFSFGDRHHDPAVILFVCLFFGEAPIQTNEASPALLFTNHHFPAACPFGIWNRCL
jgi:hypothetical protein